MSLLENLPHTAELTRPKYDVDELGANIQADSAVDSDLQCWVQNANQREVDEYQKRDTIITHKVFFGSDVDIRPGDDLTITDGPSFVGIKLEYRAGPTDRSAGLGKLFAAMFEQQNNLRRT